MSHTNSSIASNLKQLLFSWSPVISHVISSATVLYLISSLIRSLKKGGLVGIVTALPGGEHLVNSQIEEQVKQAIGELFPEHKNIVRFRSIPVQSTSGDKILNMLKERKEVSKDLNPKEGKAWAYVYDAGESHTKLTSEANQMFLHTNCLNPMVFSSLRDMENEVVRMTASMLHGDENVVGNITTGGTESLLMIVKTYRDYARATNGIVQPEMVLPITAHPAFAKASQYFGVKQVFVDIDPITKLPNLKEYESKVNKNTIVCIVSATQYPHGIIDPIVEIAKIAKKNNTPLHVDACIGGFVLPWIEKLGKKIDPWDFRVEGVTSISSDVHKYGYCSKGASVVLYRNPQVRRYQFSTFTQWPGGYYVSPSALGSRGGGPIASAWASMIALGEEGFLSRTQMILDTFNYILNELKIMKDVHVIGNPIGFIISFESSDTSKLNIYSVADVMEKKGWKIERQLYPDSIHCTLMPQHFAVKERFIQDLKDSIEIVKQEPEKYLKNGTAAMYGALADLGNINKDTLESDEKGFLDTFLTCYTDYTYRY